MTEPAWIMALWSIGTALLAAGAAWGAVRATQAQFRDSLTKMQITVRNLSDRVQNIDKEHVSHDQCHMKQGDCLDNHRSWQTSVTTQLTDLKTMVAVMDEKREAARFEMMKNSQTTHSVPDADLQKLLTKVLGKLE